MKQGETKALQEAPSEKADMATAKREQPPLQKCGVHVKNDVLVAQRVKRLPPMRETRVQSLGREDPLEKEMATHSSIHSCLESSMDRGAW